MSLRGLLLPDQPRLPWRRVLTAAAGVAVAVGLLGLLGGAVDLTLLFLGFAPSCLLVFMLPEAPVAQPVAVVGGHLISALIGVLSVPVLPFEWWSAAIVAGLAAGGMAAARVIHPPAVATAVIALANHAAWSFLLLPVLAASATIVLLGLVWHRVRRVPYPVAGLPAAGSRRTR